MEYMFLCITNNNNKYTKMITKDEVSNIVKSNIGEGIVNTNRIYDIKTAFEELGFKMDWIDDGITTPKICMYFVHPNGEQYYATNCNEGYKIDKEYDN